MKTISLCHATKRPHVTKKCHELWLSMAKNPERVEIVLGIDLGDEALFDDFNCPTFIGRENSCVAAWNAAAAGCKGDILIGLDDDWEPVQDWDEVVEARLGDNDVLRIGDLHRKDDLICHAIVSRDWYETVGYLYHPLFKSVYCDNFFTQQAIRHANIADATDIQFIHKNPSQGYGVEDEVARNSNSPARYEHGRMVFDSLMGPEHAILAFTCAGRPMYLQESLESWLKNDLSLVKSVQFFVEPTNQRDLILAIIDDFALKCPVPVIVHKNKEVLGVLKNPWHLFENCFSGQMASRVILGEDDFVVAPDTLRFLLSMTTHMDNKTMAVCAKWVGKNADHNPETWHRSTEFTGNIWMMPRHIWKDYVRDTWDFDYSSGNADQTPSGWDWNIQLRVIPRNGLHCIVPTASRSRHIGVDGVHCHKDVFDETVAWNAINTPYSGSYIQLGHHIVRSTKTYSGVKHVTSSGDLGDIIVSLATLHHLGCEAVYLLRDNGQTKGITSKIDIIKPILMAQPYVKDVKIYEGEHVDWQSEGFRSGWVQNDMSLAHNHAKHALDHGFISTMPNLSERWLFHIEPSKMTRGRVVINRSPRYGNPHFPWRKVVEFYGEKLLFLGLDHEHRAFCDAFGAVEYKHTANMLEAAELIAGSKLFIGNQSSCMTIAEGMKHHRIQEGSLVISDCVYPNSHNAQYVFDGSVNLPCLSDDTVYHIDSQVKTWRSYLVNEVPICGNGIIGWHYQCGNVMVNEGYFDFAVKKVKKLTGWDDETASKAIVEFTVALNPQWFEKKVRLPQLDVARRALRNAGYTKHPIL